MDLISTQTLTQISVHPVPFNGPSASPHSGLAMNGNGKKSGEVGYFGLETDRVCDVVIIGASDQVDVARIRCLVAIDEFVSIVLEQIIPFFSNAVDLVGSLRRHMRD